MSEKSFLAGPQIQELDEHGAQLPVSPLGDSAEVEPAGRGFGSWLVLLWVLSGILIVLAAIGIYANVVLTQAQFGYSGDSNISAEDGRFPWIVTLSPLGYPLGTAAPIVLAITIFAQLWLKTKRAS